MTLRHGDLFSGIGGFALAGEWFGWQTQWFAEVDPYAVHVLAHHWPDVPQLGDITRVDWSTVAPVDVITAGFPCQPHSVAGLRKASEDDRDLFGEIIRAARVLRPRFLVLENVPGLLTSESGRFFGRVLGALAACGYDAEWSVVSAAAVGAPHKRERVWIVAYAGRGSVQCVVRSGAASGALGSTEGDAPERQWRGGHLGLREPSVGDERLADAGRESWPEPYRHSIESEQSAPRRGDDSRRGADVGDADHQGSQGHGRSVGLNGAAGRHTTRRHSGAAGARLDAWSDATPVRGADGTGRLIPREAAEAQGAQSGVRLLADGLPDGLARIGWPVAEAAPGRVAQLKALGNAIVPQSAAAWAMSRVMELHGAMEVPA